MSIRDLSPRFLIFGMLILETGMELFSFLRPGVADGGIHLLRIAVYCVAFALFLIRERALRTVGDSLQSAPPGERDEVRLYRTIFQQTHQLMALLGPDGEIREINRSALRFFSRERDEVLGRTAVDLFIPSGESEAREKIQQWFEQARKGEVVHNRMEFRSEEGHDLFLDISLTPHRDHSGEVRFIIAEGRDIAEQFRIERIRTMQSSVTRILSETVDEREAMTLLLIEIIRGFRCEAGEYWKREGAESPPILADYRIRNFPELERQEYARAFEEAGADFHRILPLYLFEGEGLLCTDGEVEPLSSLRGGLWVREKLHCVFALLLRIGNRTTGILLFWKRSAQPLHPFERVILEDLAAQIGNFLLRISFRETLALSEKKFRTLLDQSMDVILVVDMTTRSILYANNVVLYYLGYEKEELLGLSFLELIPDRNEEIRQEDASSSHVSVSGGVIQERWIRTKEGKLIPMDMTISTLDWDTELYAYLINLRDASDRYTYERERQRMEQQMQETGKMEAIGQLAAGVAHEINTPTQYIGSNLEFVTDSFARISRILEESESLWKGGIGNTIRKSDFLKLRDDFYDAEIPYLIKEIPGALEESREGLNRVLDIVRAMKDLSHPGREDKEWMDVRRAVESTLTLSYNEWKYVSEVFTNFENDPGNLYCYPGKFKQVLLNILVNAAQAISDTEDARFGVKGRIDVVVRRDEEWLEIEISDTGPGIPPEIQKRIFEPFFTTKEVGKGSGQGLAISHSIVVKDHGGQISVKSVKGKGATFLIRIPTDRTRVEELDRKSEMRV